MKRIFEFASSFLIVFVFLLGVEGNAAPTYHKKLPKYEMGLGGGTFLIPHYPGSDQAKLRTLFLPYVVYRGDLVKVDQNGKVRADFIESDRYDVDVSMSGAFPATSKENDARMGMEDLDWIGEFGPRLVLHLVLPKKDRGLVDLNLPVRWVFSTNFGRVDHRGYTFAPSIVYRRDRLFNGKLVFLSSVTSIFGTESLMDYFYEVPQNNVTADRPEYDAKGGYMGSTLLLGLGQRFNSKLLAFAGFQFSNYSGVANEDSPLLRAEWTSTIGVGLSWKFYSSKENVRSTWKTEVY